MIVVIFTNITYNRFAGVISPKTDRWYSLKTDIFSQSGVSDDAFYYACAIRKKIHDANHIKIEYNNRDKEKGRIMC